MLSDTEHIYETVIKLANKFMAERSISNGQAKDDKYHKGINGGYGVTKQTDCID